VLWGTPLRNIISNLWERQEHNWEHDRNTRISYIIAVVLLNEILSRTLNPRNSGPEFNLRRFGFGAVSEWQLIVKREGGDGNFALFEFGLFAAALETLRC
jgi:hypothetical protein